MKRRARPQPRSVQLVWGLVVVVAIGCVWVVWDAYDEQVERSQRASDAEAPEAGFRPAEQGLTMMDAPIGAISLGLKSNLRQ